MIIAPKKFGRQNSAYRHRNMKGAFGNESALRFSRSTSLDLTTRLSTKLNQLIETKITPAVMSKAPSASRRVSFSFKTNAAITLMMMTLNPWNG